VILRMHGILLSKGGYDSVMKEALLLYLYLSERVKEVQLLYLYFSSDKLNESWSYIYIFVIYISIFQFK
jgi:hypothetical protein